MRWLDSIIDSMATTLNKPREIVEDRGGWSAATLGSQKVGHDLVTEEQQQIDGRTLCQARAGLQA